MLGLGDVVMPGLLLCFVLRYDAYKKTQLLPGGCETGVPPPRHINRISYFHCSLIGYFLGLLTATVSSEVFKAAQPALLYLVPFTLLPLLTMAYLKVFINRRLSVPSHQNALISSFECFREIYVECGANRSYLSNLLSTWKFDSSHGFVYITQRGRRTVCMNPVITYHHALIFIDVI